MVEAHARGFDNCVLLDQEGHVAELAIANLFMAKDGVVFTPAANGTFLDGITRQRVIKLLRDDGVNVVETRLRYGDFETADEIFAIGQSPQGAAGDADRRPRAAARPDVQESPRPLLGLRARAHFTGRVGSRSAIRWFRRGAPAESNGRRRERCACRRASGHWPASPSHRRAPASEPDRARPQ